MVLDILRLHRGEWSAVTALRAAFASVGLRLHNRRIVDAWQPRSWHILSAECWGSNFGVDLWPRSPWICTSVVLTFWQRQPWYERVVHASIHALKCSLLLLQPHFKEDLAAGRHGSRRCFELNVAWAGARFGVVCFFWEARWRNTCRLCRQGRAKG